MDFTKEQAQAIFTRNKDILVSAGAGAGKTRVLVERIVSLLLDQENAISANELLVLTFTNAAAAEMKERLCQALEERKEKNRRDYRLSRQIRMIKSADISTVHSYCSRLIRTYFQELGIDPSFRIGEEGEMQLLKQKVMEELLEDCYRRGKEDFLEFIEAFAPGKDDKEIEKLIQELYDFSINFPDPEEWLEQMVQEAFKSTSPDYFYKSNLCAFLFRERNRELRIWKNKLLEAESLFDGANVPRYWQQHNTDLLIALDLYEAEDFKQLSEISKQIEFGKSITARKDEKAWAGLEEIKKLHKSFKDYVELELCSSCISNENLLLKENTVQARRIKVLCQLAKDYSQSYQKEKQAKNIYDYNDLEHFALQILIDGKDDEGNPLPSFVAKDLRQKYKAIFVDEYQDTNVVQETLINMIHDSSYNTLFVVGDVKQSIYRFRQARPDLFIRRYESYQKEEENALKIELRDNFRSGPDVLKYCNYIFQQWMRKDFGGVSYGKDIALQSGEGSPLEKHCEQNELLILTEDESKEELDITLDKTEGESLMIARRIKELLEEGYAYKDIAILSRSVSTYGEEIAKILQTEGIPCICPSQTGYFESREVSLMLNYLSVIDNVYQDIPMASVLLSSIGGFHNSELVSLKLKADSDSKGNKSLYDLILHLSQQEEDTELHLKCREFLSQLLYFRRRRKEIPLHELLWEIYQKTGYIYEIMLYDDNQEKRNNLMMLIQKAQEYEKTVYKGLFYFIRYMNQLKTYELESGKKNTEDEQKDAVRIMTIHKSKGLEFPVVILSRLHKAFNTQDLKGSLCLHPEYGIGLDYVNLDQRTRGDSFQKAVIKERLSLENLEEELRILYVAMTRAKRKLILTACAKEEKLGETIKDMDRYFDPRSAKNTFEWVLAAMIRDPGARIHFSKILNLPLSTLEEENEKEALNVRIQFVRYPDLQTEEEEEEEKLKISLEEFLQGKDREDLQKAVEYIRRKFSYQYPFAEAIHLKRKYSVSELKKLAQVAQKYEEQNITVPEKTLSPLKGKELEAAKRGTIVHKVMELLPFGQIHNAKDLFDALDLVRKSYPQAKEIPAKQLYAYARGFLFSDIGQEIRDFDQLGYVQKELPFTIGLPSGQVQKENQSNEIIMVQGIIDLAIFTKDGIWLIDYKTDRVSQGKELLDRYREQMLYYKIALEQVTEQKIAKVLIYSFPLAEFIEITDI